MIKCLGEEEAASRTNEFQSTLSKTITHRKNQNQKEEESLGEGRI
jgi:hypothetical protein